MSNKSSNDRGGQRPSPRPSVSLGQLGHGDTPLLIPITPNSTIEEINRVVAEAGAPRVELLVPDGTSALQSIAGNEMLREAAKAAGVRVTLFTADEKTTHAARFAKLDVVSVGGTVSAPRPGDVARRPTGPRPVVKPAPPLGAAPASQSAPAPAQPRRTASPPASPAPATTPGTPRPPRAPEPVPEPAATDAAFLSQLNVFDQAPPEAAPRVQESDEGALMYDVPGDAGVPRPANNDAEWQAAFGDLDSTIAQDAPAVQPVREPRARRPRPVEEPVERLERPSIFGALFGRLPGRSRRAPDVAAADTRGPRMARPERTVEETAARRRQSRNLALAPLVLVALVGLAAVALLVYAVRGNLDVGSILGANTPTLTLEAPVNQADPVEFTDQVVPLVRDPVTDPASINVQGALLTAPVTVVRQGTAAGSTVAPIGFARGSITLRNRSSQAVTIPAGTEVEAGGQRFAFENTVTVPASTVTDVGITFGVREATLVARNPGAEGNIPAGTIAAIPGYSGTLTVAQPAPFGGGRNDPVQIVAPSDVEQLLPQALSQLYGQGVQALQSQVQQLPGFAIVKGENTSEITPTEDLLKDVQPGDYAVFPPIGQVAQDGRFTLQVSETFAALASPVDKPIDQELQRAVANQIKQQRPGLAGANIRITSWDRSDQGIVVDAIAIPQTESVEVPPELARDIAHEIAGKPREEAQAYLEQLKANGTVGDFTLPDEWRTVPPDVEVRFAAAGSATE